MSIVVVSAYFNFFERVSRSINYSKFRKKILEENIPLITVALEKENTPRLAPEANESIVSIPHAGILWQKEALWQRGILEARKMGFKKVLCLDGDVYFPQKGALKLISEHLDYYEILHPWDLSLHAYEDGTWNMRKSIIQIFEEFGNVRSYQMSGSYIQDLQKVVELSKAHNIGCSDRSQIRNSDDKVLSSPGYGIGLSQRALASFEFYPYAIVGGGDLINLGLMYFALKYPHENIESLYTNHLVEKTKWTPQTYKESFCRWIEKEVKKNSYKMGAAAGINIVSLSHGVLENRKYHNRLRMLELDFSDELFIKSPEGALDWKDPDSPFAQGIKRYFIERND
ncbi:MAG: hypothetical protein R3A80_09770 [Bdellovibrionota bacterium]